jgi:hypothetical protein
MPHTPFRFIHTSDWHLERPAGGITELAEPLKSALLDAPYRAAARIVDLAIQERVDFLVLSGDIVRLSESGPRGILFLCEQFQRLADRQIEIYWAGGECDPPEDWPTTVRLSQFVFRFPTERTATYVQRRGNDPVCNLIGTSSTAFRRLLAADFTRPRADIPTIAVAYGQVEDSHLSQAGVSYWALGGDHRRQSPLVTGTNVHYPGMPQGRLPGDDGAQGCTLVSVDDTGRIRTTSLPTDLVRYTTERITLSPGATSQVLEKALLDRAKALYTGELGPCVVVRWVVAGCDELQNQLRRGRLADQLLARVREETASLRPVVWSDSLVGESAYEFDDAALTQDSLLGEFLRTVQQFQNEPERSLDVETFLPMRYRGSSLADRVRIHDADERENTLREAARLGARLFSGEEALS